MNRLTYSTKKKKKNPYQTTTTKHVLKSRTLVPSPNAGN